MHLKCFVFSVHESRLLSEWLKVLLSQNPRRWDQHVHQYLNTLGFLNTGTSLCYHIDSSLLVSAEDSSYYILSLFTGMYPKSNSFHCWSSPSTMILFIIFTWIPPHLCSWRTEVRQFSLLSKSFNNVHLNSSLFTWILPHLYSWKTEVKQFSLMINHQSFQMSFLQILPLSSKILHISYSLGTNLQNPHPFRCMV